MIKIGDAVLSVNPDMDPLQKGFDAAQVFAKKAGQKVGKFLSDGLDKGIKKAAEFGKEMQDVGKKATVAGGVITGAFALVGGAALKTSSDLDAASAKMAASLGKPREEAVGLREDIKAIFADNFGDSIEDVGRSATGVVSALEAVGASVDSNVTRKITSGAIAIRDAFETDIPETMDAVTGLMDNFGLTAEQSLDFVAAGMQKGLNKSGDFIDSIREYGVQFAGAGADAGQFFSVLETGLQSGNLGTDKAADLFKEFRIRIQDESELTRSSLERIGISSAQLEKDIASGQTTVAEAFSMVQKRLRDTKDPLARFNVGVALFGTQFEDLGEKAALALDTTSTKLEDLAGATENLEDQYKTIGSLASGAFREISTALDPIGQKIRDVLLANWDEFEATIERVAELAPVIGEAFGSVLTSIIDVVVPMVKSTAEWMVQHAGLTQVIVTSVGVLGLLLAFLGPVLVAFGSILGALPKIAAGFGLMKTATFGVVGAVKALVPFLAAGGPLLIALGAAALAIAAVGKAWFDLKKAQDDLQKSTEAVETKLQEFAAKLGDNVAEELARIEDLDQKIQFINQKNQESIRAKFAALIEEIKGAEATAAEIDRAVMASLGSALTKEMDATTAALVALNTETQGEIEKLLKMSGGQLEEFLADLQEKTRGSLDGVGQELVSVTAAQVEQIQASSQEFAAAQSEFTNATVEEFNKRREVEGNFFAFSNESFQKNRNVAVEASQTITNADVEGHNKRTQLVQDHTGNVAESAQAQVKLWADIGDAATRAAAQTEGTWLQRLDRILLKVAQVQAKIARAIAQSSELGSLSVTSGSGGDSSDKPPGFARGGTQHQDGLAFLHGNMRPELAYLPRGTRIFNPEQTREVMAPAGGEMTLAFDFRGANLGKHAPEDISERVGKKVNKVLRDHGIHTVIRT